jgi:hypothetical protein
VIGLRVVVRSVRIGLRSRATIGLSYGPSGGTGHPSTRAQPSIQGFACTSLTLGDALPEGAIWEIELRRFDGPVIQIQRLDDEGWQNAWVAQVPGAVPWRSGESRVINVAVPRRAIAGEGTYVMRFRLHASRTLGSPLEESRRSMEAHITDDPQTVERLLAQSEILLRQAGIDPHKPTGARTAEPAFTAVYYDYLRLSPPSGPGNSTWGQSLMRSMPRWEVKNR